MLESHAKKSGLPAERGRQLIETISLGLKGDGFAVTISEPKTAQRILRLEHRQVTEFTVGFKSRIRLMPPGTVKASERWVAHWNACDGWVTLALVIGCLTSELLGW